MDRNDGYDPKWNGNGWTKYQLMVLSQLENHHKDLAAMNEKISNLRVEISALKVQAGIWGLIAGLIPVVIGLALTFMGNHAK
jgi:hypothetical protein